MTQPKQLKYDSLKNVIEIGQLGSQEKNYFLHGQESVSDGLLEVFKKSSEEPISFEKASGNFGYPSTTIKEFMKNDAVDESLIGQSVYVGNFDSEYSNNFYNSMFDSTDKMGLDFSKYCMTKGRGLSNILYDSTGGISSKKWVSLSAQKWVLQALDLIDS